MSVAKVIEISSESTRSFEDAIRRGLARAAQTLDNVSGAWIAEQQVQVEDGEIIAYRVNMKVTFVLNDAQGDDVNDEGQSLGRGTSSSGPARRGAPAGRGGKLGGKSGGTKRGR